MPVNGIQGSGAPTCSQSDTKAGTGLVDRGYAIAKMVPEIARCAVFETNYGTLRLGDLDSHKVAVLVEKLLRAKLRKAGGQ